MPERPSALALGVLVQNVSFHVPSPRRWPASLPELQPVLEDSTLALAYRGDLIETSVNQD